MITLTLPFPPSVNRIWRNFGGRTILSAIGRKYRQDVQLAIAQNGSPRLGSMRVAVTIVVHAPDRRKRDLDNVCKAILDGLQHAGVFDDDSQVDKLLVLRHPSDKTDPRVVVSISEYQTFEQAA